MDNMTDSKVLDRMIERIAWEEKVPFDELRTTLRMDGDRLYVNEGTAERWADIRALNYVTFAIWRPQEAFSLLREQAPNNAEDLLEDFDTGLVNATTPQVKEDKFESARTMGFVRKTAALTQELANDTREDNYTYRVYRLLAESEPKLNIGTNPLGKTKEFYAWRHIVCLTLPEQDESELDVELDSAAEAGW